MLTLKNFIASHTFSFKLSTDMSNHASSSTVSPPPTLLQRDYVHCPITALAFFSTTVRSRLYILSGEDTHLHIRDVVTSQLCASVQIFPAQPIHGIFSSCSPPSSPSRIHDEADDKILIWGGPYVTVLTRSTVENLLRPNHSSPDLSSSSFAQSSRLGIQILKAPGWIYHGAVSECDSSRAVIVTAHNEILPLHILATTPSGGSGSGYDDDEGIHRPPRLRFGKLRAPRTSRPILYSAQVRWTGKDEVLVAAGTVFGEIVVWRCRGIVDDYQNDAENEEDESGRGVDVLFVFTGHEGSIFGVDISPEMSVVVVDSDEKDAESAEKRRMATTVKRRLLASCSDDRTIRIWDITGANTGTLHEEKKQPKPVAEDEKEMEKTRRHQHHFTEARETGFGANILPSLEASASHVSSVPLAMAMGHVSRIWNVRFASSPTRGEGAVGVATLGDDVDNLVLYSFGEDATAQKWRLGNLENVFRQQQDAIVSTAGVGGATLTHQAILLRHSGKQVWSSAVLRASDNRTLVATGGSDGKIHLVEDVEGGYPGSVMLTVAGSEVCRRFPCPSAGIEVQNQNQDNDETKEAQEQEQQERISDLYPESKTPTKKRKTKIKKSTKDEEPFQMYAILSRTSFLATTPMGRIFKGSLTGAASIAWDEVPLERNIRDDLRQYQIVRELKGSRGKALLASTTGKLYLYSDYHDGSSSIRQVYQMPGKIADVFPLPSGNALPDVGVSAVEWSSSDIVPIIVTTMGNPQIMRLLLLDTAMGAATICQAHTIELDKGFIVTAAGCCRGYLVFGSRTGALTVYKASRSQTTGRDLQFHQITRVDRPFTKDSVSSIIPLPSKKTSLATSSPCPYFLTTSRDGRYRIYELNTTSPQEVQVHLRHEAVPPLGPVIEGAFFTTSTDANNNQQPELILAGFRSQDFVVWNETRQTEVAKVECGGAYRSFTYHVEDNEHNKDCSSSSSSDSSRNVTFVWTRASRTCVYSYSSSSHDERGEQQQEQQQRNVNADANAAGITTLKSGGHGREIKAVAAWGNLLATGAEDTTLRIWRCRASSNHGTPQTPSHPSICSTTTQLDCLAVVEKHTTGIQHLQWVGGGGGGGPSPSAETLYLVSSSGNEELCIWRVCPALPESAFGGLAIVCEGVYADKTRDGDLRIMGFDVQVLPQNKTTTKDESVVEEGHDKEEVVFCLSLVLSNSTLRTYRYSKTGGFVMLAEGRYTGACLMQIRHLNLGLTIPSTNTPAAEMHVVTASTDGVIALWKATVPSASTMLDKKISSVAPSCTNNDEADKQTPPLEAAKGGEYTKYTLVEAARLHQSSIKSLDLLSLPSSSNPPSSDNSSISPSLPSSSYLLVTGGDDNALGFAHLHLPCPPPPPTAPTTPTSQLKIPEQKNQHHFTIARRALVNGAHAAAITGLAITSLSQNLSPLPPFPSSSSSSSSCSSPPSQIVVSICTASNDQRVKSWRVNLSLNSTIPTTANNNSSSGNAETLVQKVALVASQYSSVADCGDLEVFKGKFDDKTNGWRNGEKRIVIVGVGMEVWKV